MWLIRVGLIHLSTGNLANASYCKVGFSCPLVFLILTGWMNSLDISIYIKVRAFLGKCSNSDHSKVKIVTFALKKYTNLGALKFYLPLSVLYL